MVSKPKKWCGLSLNRAVSPQKMWTQQLVSLTSEELDGREWLGSGSGHFNPGQTVPCTLCIWYWVGRWGDTHDLRNIKVSWPYWESNPDLSVIQSLYWEMRGFISEAFTMTNLVFPMQTYSRLKQSVFFEVHTKTLKFSSIMILPSLSKRTTFSGKYKVCTK